MKIKNLAFFGIMAAILGVNGAARADSTTIIASQAYVDAKDALKQDQNRRIQTAYSAYSQSDTDEQKKDYPSMYTLEEAIATASSDASNMKDTAASATWANNTLSIVTDADTAGNKTDKVATSNQVQTSISALKSYTDYTKQAKSTANYSMGKSDGTWEAMSQGQQDALNSGITSSLVTQIGTNQTDISTNASNITALNAMIEKGLTTEQQTLYDAWVEGGRKPTDITQLLTDMGVDATDNVVSDYQKEHQNLIPRNRNIQKGIAYLKGNGIEYYTPGVTNDDSANVGIQNGTVKEAAIKAWNDNLNKHGDEFVPTVASVERRVQAAEAAAGSGLTGMKDTTDAATTASGATTLTVNDGDDNHFYTADAVEAGFTAVNTAIGNMALDAQTGDGVIKTVAQTNGKVTVTRDTVAEADIANSAVTTDKLGSKAVTAGKIADDTITATQIASDAVDTNEIKNSAVTNAKIADGAVTNAKISANSLAYKDTMDPKLSNVNATGDSETAMKNCTLKSPCTLTMIWSDGKPVYEWTNMDTEDTSATL